MHSSVAEQWIADPRVTGSNPVVPFLFAFGAMSWRIAPMRCARLRFGYRSIAMDAVQQGDKLGTTRRLPSPGAMPRPARSERMWIEFLHTFIQL